MLSESVLPVLFFLIALLYASVGHGGASGYIALLVIAGFGQSLIRPCALSLNIIVSLIATLQYRREGHFRKELFLPFIITSVPFAFLGARIPLTDSLFKVLLAGCLLVATGRILIKSKQSVGAVKSIPPALAAAIGAAIGLISGVVGIGGGILLSPILLIGRWSTVREAAAVAAPFILVNSLAAAASVPSSFINLRFAQVAIWIAAVSLGGILGAYFGSRRFGVRMLNYILAAVLLIAAGKLLLP